MTIMTISSHNPNPMSLQLLGTTNLLCLYGLAYSDILHNGIIQYSGHVCLAWLT